MNPAVGAEETELRPHLNYNRPGRTVRCTAALAAALVCLVALSVSCVRPPARAVATAAAAPVADAPVADAGTAIDAGKSRIIAAAPRAELLDGPFLSHGLPFIGPNVLPYWYADYRLPGETRARVYFVSDTVSKQSGWVPHTCGNYALLEFSTKFSDGNKTTDYFYDNLPQWSLLFQFTGAIPDPCPFVSEFIGQFNFFYTALYKQQAYGPTDTIPFPAIITLP